MENCPENVATWLGLSKIGVISAMINTSLKSKPLIHTIKASKAVAVVYSASLEKCILIKGINLWGTKIILFLGEILL